MIAKFGIFLWFGFSLIATSAFASAGSDSHGGSSVVCFNQKVTSELIDEQGRFSSKGIEAIKSIVTLEYYLASLTGKWNPLIPSLQNATYSQAIGALKKALKAVPDVYMATKRAYNELGDVGVEGIGVPDGVGTVGDTGVLPNLPVECTYVQTVVRRQDSFYYNSVIWNKMTDLQKALMQLHEELYGSTNHETSQNTQLFLTYFLATDFTEKQLAEKAYKYGFGYTMTLSDTLEAGSTFLDLFQVAKNNMPKVLAGDCKTNAAPLYQSSAEGRALYEMLKTRNRIYGMSIQDEMPIGFFNIYDVMYEGILEIPCEDFKRWVSNLDEGRSGLKNYLVELGE